MSDSLDFGQSLPPDPGFNVKDWLAKNPQARAFSRPDIIAAEHDKVLGDMRKDPAAMENHWNKKRYKGFDEEIGTLSSKNRMEVMNYLVNNAQDFFTEKHPDGKRSLLPGVTQQQYNAFQFHYEKLQTGAKKHDTRDRALKSGLTAAAMGTVALATMGAGVPFIAGGMAMGGAAEGTSALMGMAAQSNKDSKNVAEYEFFQEALRGGGEGLAEYGAMAEGFDKGAKLLSKAPGLPGILGKGMQVAGAAWNATKIEKVLPAAFAGYNTYQAGSQLSQMHSALDKHAESGEPGTSPDINPEALGKSLAFTGRSIYDAFPTFKQAFSRKPFGTVSSDKNILDEFPSIGGDTPAPLKPTPPGDFFWSGPKPTSTQKLFSERAPKAPEPPPASKPPKKQKPQAAKPPEQTTPVEPPPVAPEAEPPVAEAPKEFPTGSRKDGTNSRALGTNPRALGTNPRALGKNPRALGTNPSARKKPEEYPKVDPEKATKQGELFPDMRGKKGKKPEKDDTGNTAFIPMTPWAMGAQLAMGQRVLPRPVITPKPPQNARPSTASEPGSTGGVGVPHGSPGKYQRFEKITPHEEIPKDLEILPPVEEPPKFEPGKGLEFTTPETLPEVETPGVAIPEPQGTPGAPPTADVKIAPRPSETKAPEEETVPVPQTETKPTLETPPPVPPVAGKTDPTRPGGKDSEDIMSKLMPFLALLGAGGDAPSFPSVAHGIPAQSAPSFEKTHLDISYFTDLGM